MSQPPSKLIIVVLYNCAVSSSATLSAVLSSKLIRTQDKVMLWDNSAKQITSADRSELDGLAAKFEYVHTPENTALSVVYNNCVKANMNYDFALIFDQDSAFDDTFFEAFENAYHDNPSIALFLPLITMGQQVVSPGHYHQFKGKYWKKAVYGIVESKNNIAIASGLIIKIAALQRIGYFEEKLNLYGIDTNFMIRYSRVFDQFFVLNAHFAHDLSAFNDEIVTTKLRRFNNHKSAALFNASLFPLSTQVIARVYYFYKSLTYAVKYKSFKFFA